MLGVMVAPSQMIVSFVIVMEIVAFFVNGKEIIAHLAIQLLLSLSQINLVTSLISIQKVLAGPVVFVLLHESCCLLFHIFVLAFHASHASVEV